MTSSASTSSKLLRQSKSAQPPSTQRSLQIQNVAAANGSATKEQTSASRKNRMLSPSPNHVATSPDGSAPRSAKSGPSYSASGNVIRHVGMSTNGFDNAGNVRVQAAATSIAAQHVVQAEVHHENQAAHCTFNGSDCHSPLLPPAVSDVISTDGRRSTSMQAQRSPTDSLHSSGSNGSRGGERTGSSPVWETLNCQQGQRATRQTPSVATSPAASAVASGSMADSRGRGGRQLTAISSHDRSTVRQTPSPSNKSEEELEKMRILARHVKIYTDWANHYLEKINYSKTSFITDLQSDLSTGVVVSDLILAVVNERVPNINRKPQTAQQMVSNIEKCLVFLTEHGASVDGIEAKNVHAGSLKSILGLLFNLSNYKHQQYQQHQQQQLHKSGASVSSGVGSIGEIGLQSSGAVCQQQQQLLLQLPLHQRAISASVEPSLSSTDPAFGAPSRRQLPPVPASPSQSGIGAPTASVRTTSLPRSGQGQGNLESATKSTSASPGSRLRVQSATSSNDTNYDLSAASSGQNETPHKKQSDLTGNTSAAGSKKQSSKTASSAGRKTEARATGGGNADLALQKLQQRSTSETSSKSAASGATGSMLTRFRIFNKDRSADGGSKGRNGGKDEVSVPSRSVEPETVEMGRIPAPASTGSQRRQQQIQPPTCRTGNSAPPRAGSGRSNDVIQSPTPTEYQSASNGINRAPAYCGSPQPNGNPAHHLVYSQIPVVPAVSSVPVQYTGPQTPIYYGTGSGGYQQGYNAYQPQSPSQRMHQNGYQQQQQQQPHPAAVSHLVSPTQSRLHQNGCVSPPPSVQPTAGRCGGGVPNNHHQAPATSDGHHRVSSAPGSTVYGVQSPQLVHQSQQQQQARHQVSSSLTGQQQQRQTDRRRYGDEQPPGSVQSQLTKSSMSSRTASSTSISSIASSTTTGNGSGTTPRKSGLARRVSSASSGQHESTGNAYATASNKRTAKSAASSASSSSSRNRSTKASSSTSGATSSSTKSKLSQNADSGTDGGTIPRQTLKNSKTDDGPGPETNAATASSKSALTSKIGVPGGRSDATRSSTARVLPMAMTAQNKGALATKLLESVAMDCTPQIMDNISADPSQSALEKTGPVAPTRNITSPTSSKLPSKLAHTGSSSSGASKTSKSAVEQLRLDSGSSFNNGNDLGAGAAARSPSRVASPLAPEMVALARPQRDKSSGSVSSGFGDESNHSTSDSTDSVIYQPAIAVTSSPTPSSQRTAAIPPQRRHVIVAATDMETSSSSAIDSDVGGGMTDSGLEGKNQLSPTKAVVSSVGHQPMTSTAIDHIASLRTSNRLSGGGGTRPASTTPGSSEVTKPDFKTNEGLDAQTKNCSIPDSGSGGTTPVQATDLRRPSDSSSSEDAFDVQPMQPIVRPTVSVGVVPPSCTIYQPPTTRRLPTLLAAQTANAASSGIPPSGSGSAARRLAFGRPLIAPSSRYPVGQSGGGSSRALAATIASSGSPYAASSITASGYMSDGEILHRTSGHGGSAWKKESGAGSSNGRAGAGGCRGGTGSGNGHLERTSGYASEGGGGASASYARRMQQRFLEGILAVRQSMERSAHITDDDSFDDCSSLSSDEGVPPLATGNQTAIDETEVDAILENVSSPDGSNGGDSSNRSINASAEGTNGQSSAVMTSSSSARLVGSRGTPVTPCSGLRQGFHGNPDQLTQLAGQRPTVGGNSMRSTSGSSEVDRILGNGWKKYYIDCPNTAASSPAVQPRSAGTSVLMGPFERGSSQRVTLPLGGPSSLLVKRSHQSVVTDLRTGNHTVDQRSSGSQLDVTKRSSSTGPPTESQQQQHSGSGAAGRRSSSSEAQRGERLSNYSQSGSLLLQRQQQQHQQDLADVVATTDVDEWDSGGEDQLQQETSANGCRRSGNGVVGFAGRSSSVVHKDGGQGPAPQNFHSMGGGGTGFHDYVNINYVASSKSLTRNDRIGRPPSGANSRNIQQWLRAAAAGLACQPFPPNSAATPRFPGGRMAMSETESIENIAAAAAFAAAGGWPGYVGCRTVGNNGRELVQRSDSLRSSSTDHEANGQLTSSSLPRCGSAAQVWNGEGGTTVQGSANGTPVPGLRLPAGSGYAALTGFCSGQPRTPSTSVYSTPLLPAGGRSRLSGGSKDDNVHSSTLSLGSNSSAYSTAEEQQAHEIRRLRQELEAAQSKICSLSTQLSTNAHVVSAFEQSLANMTHRLQHLAANTDQKEAELNELRRTIELLRKQGYSQFNLHLNRQTSASSSTSKDMSVADFMESNSDADQQLMRRHMSTDSVVSLSSGGSHQNGVADNCDKKKKPKAWLKIPFGKAFARTKKLKPTGSTSDAESDTASLYTDASLAQSAQAQLSHGGGSGAMSVPSTPIKISRSDALLSGGSPGLSLAPSSPGRDQSVVELQQQLREKDMKLTDIRLEALSSAHQLEQLRDTMNRMKNEMMSLKLDNERLQQLIEQKGINPASVLDSHRHSGPPQPHHSNRDAEHRLSLDDPAHFDLLLPADTGSRGSQRITLSIRPSSTSGEATTLSMMEILIRIISITGQTTWDQLTEIIRKGFKDYLARLDPGTSLGLNGSSIKSLRIGDVEYTPDASVPELLPCGYLVGENTNVSVSLQGACEKSVDSLAFDTLIPKSIIQRYISLLTEHRRIILCGPSGTGKTFLAHRLAEYLVWRAGEPLGPKSIATFSVDHKSGRELRQYLSNVADQCEHHSPELPVVIILDSLHHVTSLSEVFNGFLSVDYQSSPYIIGTMNQTASTCSPTNLQLHHNFRWVLCANHVEPVLGFLARYLRRRLIDAEVRRGLGNGCHGDSGANESMERVVDWIPRVWQHLNKFLETHSSTDVTVGPRLFLSCPMDVDAVQVWFTDLWNYSIVPYLLEAIKEGVQTYGSRVPWEDPSEWVVKTYPWTNPASQGGANDTSDWPPLLRLRPEDVGYDSNQTAGTANSSTATKVAPVPAQGESESSDPLLNMLMRLQEAAGYTNNNMASNANNELGAGFVDLSAM